jgi:hypothetical protein
MGRLGRADRGVSPRGGVLPDPLLAGLQNGPDLSHNLTDMDGLGSSPHALVR